MITGPLDVFIGVLVYFAASAFAMLIVIAPFGLFVGWLAKKLGKNPWIWGCFISTVFGVMVVLKLPNLFAGIFDWEMKHITGQEETVLVLLKDAHKVVMHERVDSVNFDVPLTYMNRSYYPQAHGWQNVTKSQYDGKVRRTYDYIYITALLPELDPMSEQNYREFEKLGYGLKVRASLTHPVTRDYYFKNSFASLKRQPDDPDVPGMMHFYDLYGKQGKANIFFSHDHPAPDFTSIRCMEYTVPPPHPTCEVDTVFVYKANYRYRLTYSFARAYLPQWREIDRKMKALFELFAEATPQNLSQHP